MSAFKGIANLQMVVGIMIFLLIQIRCPYIVWNNFPKFQENRESSFWDMRQSMCEILVGEYHYRGGGHTNQIVIR